MNAAQPILISKRAHIFYIEHAKVIKQYNNVVFYVDKQQVFYNIPQKNTSVLLLGNGTSITDGAVKLLSESNVIIGFCGGGGSPLFASSDITFLTTDSVYRPTEYMQRWIKIWLDNNDRVAIAKELLHFRINLLNISWSKFKFMDGFSLTLTEIDNFKLDVDRCLTVNELLLTEARFQKMLYSKISIFYKIPRFVRLYETNGVSSSVDIINGMLTYGNYIAYGLAAATLNALGISFSFPILHGNTNRGGLVFDMADLIKSAYGLPMAFEYGSKNKNISNFRNDLISMLHKQEVLDLMFEFVKTTIEKYYKNQTVTQQEINTTNF